MRPACSPALALVLAAGAALAATACTPDIAPGTYLCGPEGLCPEGQACNGPDGICVLAGQARPFECGMFGDPPNDDTPATGTMLTNLSCASVPFEARGCLRETDAQDFFQLDVPAACSAVRIEASVSFPIAFQPLALVLSTAGAAPAPVDTPCPPSALVSDGEDLRCVSQVVQPGGHYALGVVKGSGGDCGGACRNNRYIFRLRLTAP
jgi:hypothetical protein